MNSIKGNIKKRLIKNLQKHPKIRRRVRHIRDRIGAQKYLNYSEKYDIDDKLVVFEAFMGQQYGCNPRAIYECMVADSAYDDYHFIWSFSDVSKEEQLVCPERTDVVEFGSQEWKKAFATAHYIVTNSNLDYRFVKKTEQVCVQTWHGTPLKRLRCDIEVEFGNANNTLAEIRQKNDSDIIRYDYFVSPSEFATEKFISAFNLEKLGRKDIIIETGYPRNDFIYNCEPEDVAEIKYRLDIEESKKIILYAPTFRDDQHDGQNYTYDNHLNFDILKNELGDEYVILFRAHYFIAEAFDFSKYDGFVKNVSEFDDISRLYVISDVLVTDYSSVFFDFGNLKRPIIFYMYDLDDYAEETRGFYIDVKELPGPIVRTTEDLAETIKTAYSDNKYADCYDAFNRKYNMYEDGHASKRVIEKMLSCE